MQTNSTKRTPFHMPSHEDWRAQIERDLKGAPFEKRLVHTTADGIPIKPLYTPADTPAHPDYSGFPGLQSRTRGEKATGRREGWQIAAVIREPSPATAISLAEDELNGGAHGLFFDSTSAWSSDHFWPQLFDSIRPTQWVISLPTSTRKNETLPRVIEAYRNSNGPDGELSLYAGIDPIGELAKTGCLDSSCWSDLAQFIAEDWKLSSRSRLLRIDDRPYHHAGASEAQSIGFTLGAAVDTLRLLEREGRDPGVCAGQLEMMLHLDCDFFLAIAKLRATRMLWNQVRQTIGFNSDLRIHSRISPRVLSQRDPWVNILRNTTSCFAGAIGGADAISTDAFDCRTGLPNETAQRLARNTQLVLSMESHLHKVIDPAGGAYFIEALTSELAQQAWTSFQAVESHGGLQACLHNGWVHKEINFTHEKRQRSINRRKRPITGVSEFPNLAEKLPEQRPSPTQDTTPANIETLDISPLPTIYFADSFESFRDRSDAWLKQHGSRPKVGLLNLGSVANHTGRSTFIRNLVEAGGFEPLISEPIFTPDEAVAYLQTVKGLPLVLCATNHDAAELARPIASALRDNTNASIWLAGQPEADMTSYFTAGIQRVVKLGDDMVAHLNQLWEQGGKA